MSHSSNRRHQQSQTSQDDKRSNVSHDQETQRKQPNPDRGGEDQDRPDRKRDDRQMPEQQNDKRDPAVKPPSADRDAPGRKRQRDDDDNEKGHGYRPGASEDYEPDDGERPGR